MRLNLLFRWKWLLPAVGVTTLLFFLHQQNLTSGPVQLLPTHVAGTELLPGSAKFEDLDAEVDSPEHSSSNVVHVSAKGRILVTGGGGMIGKQLVSRLLKSNTPVTVYDLIFMEDELDAIRAAHPNADLTYVKGDIRDIDMLKAALTDDVVGVIHLAAVSRVLWCLENEADCTDVNVRGTELVLKAMRSGWFIQASSREVYGNPKSMPVPEDTPHSPANVYGASKAQAEDVITRHVNDDTNRILDVIFLRLSNVYGSPYDHRERLIPAVMTNALAHRPIQIVGGDQDLDMVNVQDVVNAFSLAVNRLEGRRISKSAKSNVEVYNIGTDKSTSAIEIIRKSLALTNSSSPIQTVPGDSRFPDKYVGSTVKANEVLGYKARIGIDEGMHRLATAYLTQTINYIERKWQSQCGSLPRYSNADLLSLNGCSGTLAADVDGVAYYASANFPRQANDEMDGPLQFSWSDTDAPTLWNFHIKQKADGKVALSLHHDYQDRDVYFAIGGSDNVLDNASEFGAQVDPDTGFLSLHHFSGQMLPLSSFSDLWGPQEHVKPRNGTQFRITPYCCTGREPGWPFFREDPLASAILDERLSLVHRFNASQVRTRCDRLTTALDVAKHRFDVLQAYPKPITIEQAPMPTGTAGEWRTRKRDICTNLCDHPTVCLDTGDCMCSQANCVPRLRFPFAAFANLPELSYQPHLTLNWEEITKNDPHSLIYQYEKSSWQNVLRPGARRYLSRLPSFPSINLTRVPEDFEKEREHDDPDKFDRLQTEWHGCYSADSSLERGVKAISKEVQGDTMAFLPHWEYTLRFPPISEWVQNALDHHLPSGFDTSKLITTFTFDWGRCNTVLNHLFQVREKSSGADILEKASSWQPMGDLNSPCYYMDQDVVVPPRTCLQDKLRETYGDIAKVKPSRQRSVLVTFKGSPNGAGTSVRQKLSCERPYRTTHSRLTGGSELEVFWGRMKKGADYLETIGDTVFCPIPRGTTGWATRGADVIYAGCIPVLIGDQTHHPFWDVLDWAKFSVTINDIDIERLEEILLSYSWEEVQRMQANLILVRDAFLYPSEGHMDENVDGRRGPFFYAVHSAKLLQYTKFPK